MDCSLELDCMKQKLLVLEDQHASGNMFLDLTHIARHIMKEILV